MKLLNKKPLEEASPESLGISLSGIESFFHAVEASGLCLNSMMLLRHGKIAVEAYWKPFRADMNHQLCSVSKSITSTAVGFALEEGLFKLKSRIVDLLPEKLDCVPHPYISAMTVRHLLMMATPFSIWKEPVTDDWTREFLNDLPDHYPGTIFCYNTSGTHTLCEIIEKYSGVSMLDFLTPRLFDPLGIDGVEWEMSPMGVCRGGGGVRMTTQGMARFGLLYLGKGMYDGNRVLPENWVRQATAWHIDTSNADNMVEGGRGYGFQFWCTRNNGYACLGLGGQIVLVLPEQDAVFVTTANVLQEQGGRYFALELFWDHIFPAIQTAALPSSEKLKFDFSLLNCPLPNGTFTNIAMGKNLGKRFSVKDNTIGYSAFLLDCDNQQGKLILFNEDGCDTVEFGMGKYLPSETPFQKYASEHQTWGEFTFPDEKHPRRRASCESAAVWTGENTLIIRSHIINVIQSFTLTLHFGNEAFVAQIKPFGIFAYDSLPCVLTHILEEKRILFVRVDKQSDYVLNPASVSKDISKCL